MVIAVLLAVECLFFVVWLGIGCTACTWAARARGGIHSVAAAIRILPFFQELFSFLARVLHLAVFAFWPFPHSALFYVDFFLRLS